MVPQVTQHTSLESKGLLLLPHFPQTSPISNSDLTPVVASSWALTAAQRKPDSSEATRNHQHELSHHKGREAIAHVAGEKLPLRNEGEHLHLIQYSELIPPSHSALSMI